MIYLKNDPELEQEVWMPINEQPEILVRGDEGIEPLPKGCSN